MCATIKSAAINRIYIRRCHNSVRAKCDVKAGICLHSAHIQCTGAFILSQLSERLGFSDAQPSEHERQDPIVMRMVPWCQNKE